MKIWVSRQQNDIFAKFFWKARSAFSDLCHCPDKFTLAMLTGKVELGILSQVYCYSEQVWDALSKEHVEWIRTHLCLLLVLLHILGSAEPTAGIKRAFRYCKKATVTEFIKGWNTQFLTQRYALYVLRGREELLWKGIYD